MNTMFHNLHTALNKRAQYRKTLSDLRQMPLQTAIDLDLDPAAFDTLAHRTVYGR